MSDCSRPPVLFRVSSAVLGTLLLGAGGIGAQELAIVTEAEAQPLLAQARRVAEALEFAGAPLDAAQRARLDALGQEADDAAVVRGVQELLDPLALLGVDINAESRVKLHPGAAPPVLDQDGWRMFLVKVHNRAGVVAPLRVSSPQAAPVYRSSTGTPSPTIQIGPGDVRDRWMDLAVHDRNPLRKRLSGAVLDYRILELYSRDAGAREARFLADVGQGTQDLGFRNETSVLFECRPSVELVFDVDDVDGEDAMASFEIRDPSGRIYPTPAKRLAPDFFFHPQVYRRTGETLTLAPGEYQVRWTRGPEYRDAVRTIVVPEGVERHEERFTLERWIHPRASGWFSGDHHVHGGGCAHYEDPSAGVAPEDMMRHQLGEDLNIGCVLSWGPCWYAQKEYFEGDIHPLSEG